MPVGFFQLFILYHYWILIPRSSCLEAHFPCFVYLFSPFFLVKLQQHQPQRWPSSTGPACAHYYNPGSASAMARPSSVSSSAATRSVPRPSRSFSGYRNCRPFVHSTRVSLYRSLVPSILCGRTGKFVHSIAILPYISAIVLPAICNSPF